MKDFNLRSFVSLSAMLFFIMMALSGIAAYIKPEGSVASWQDWTFMGLGKGAWEELHTLSAAVFLVFSVIHIILNWQTLCLYLKRKSCLKRELLPALILLAAVTVSSLFQLPPLSLLMDAGEMVSDSWARRGAPPFEGAAEVSLRELSDSGVLKVPLGTALERLSKAGIGGVDPSMSLQQLAGEQGKSPAELYQVIVE